MPQRAHSPRPASGAPAKSGCARREEVRHEGELAPGHGLLEPVQHVLVDQLRRAVAVGAFLDDVVDATQEGVRRRSRTRSCGRAVAPCGRNADASACRTGLLLGEVRRAASAGRCRAGAPPRRRGCGRWRARRSHPRAPLVEVVPLERAARGARRPARRAATAGIAGSASSLEARRPAAPGRVAREGSGLALGLGGVLRRCRDRGTRPRSGSRDR